MESDETKSLHISSEDIKSDVNAILWGLGLHDIRRYWRQRYFTEESRAASYANRIEGLPRLETVSEHSWHVCDMVILLAPHFEYLNVGHCLKLAVLHDKLEILTGDLDPLGRDGSGDKSHAFDAGSQRDKERLEIQHLSEYILMLRESIRTEQSALMKEALEANTNESRFVKAIDKLQPMAFIFKKKRGDLEDKHIRFLFRFSSKNIRIFPGLCLHYDELMKQLCEQVADYRGLTVESFLRQILPTSTPIDLFDPSMIELPLADDVLKRFQRNPQEPEYKQYRDGSDNSKRERLMNAFSAVASMPPATNGLQAYRQVSDAMNRTEDALWGAEYWNPLRSYPPGTSTDRMYPIAPESFFPINEYPGLTALVSVNEVLILSRYGAMELQSRLLDPTDSANFNLRESPSAVVLFKKPDPTGDFVWSPKNKI